MSSPTGGLPGRLASDGSTKAVLFSVLIMWMLTPSALVAAALQVPLALSLANPPTSLAVDGSGLVRLSGQGTNRSKTCTVQPGPNGTDSAPAIIRAFQECGHNAAADGSRGRVVFLNETYHVKSVMNTTGLRHVDVDLQGTLLWDTNIDYWLNHSLPVGYQNQSSAWLFGGESVRWDGHGYGTLDGNGQVWYDFINGTNNYPGRPHQITISGTTDSVFEGIRFVQSQMWYVLCSSQDFGSFVLHGELMRPNSQDNDHYPCQEHPAREHLCQQHRSRTRGWVRFLLVECTTSHQEPRTPGMVN